MKYRIHAKISQIGVLIAAAGLTAACALSHGIDLPVSDDSSEGESDPGTSDNGGDGDSGGGIEIPGGSGGAGGSCGDTHSSPGGAGGAGTPRECENP